MSGNGRFGLAMRKLLLPKQIIEMVSDAGWRLRETLVAKVRFMMRLIVRLLAR
jgi:hypothetical protein